MKIFNLPPKDGVVRFGAGAFAQYVDQNMAYEVNVYSLAAGAEVTMGQNGFRTHYVMEGSVTVTVSDSHGKVISTQTFQSGEGWLVLPTQAQAFKAEVESKIFVINNTSPLAKDEIFERGKKEILRDDVLHPLSVYTVNKPWGSEKWFVDTTVYVFKGICMNSGFECSLQLHEQKIEVNLLLSGTARLLLGQSEKANSAIAAHHKKGGQQSDFSMSNEDVEAIRSGIQPVIIGPGDGWKADRYDIHQVLSMETYFALEVSTPEVDDIIRLKDLYHRPGGRIDSEHAAAALAKAK